MRATLLPRTNVVLKITILFCICCAMGCSTLQKPTATFKNMSVAEVNAQGFTMNFDIDVHNPNAVSLPIGSADYALSLAGVKVLEGKARPEGAIPASASLPVTLPVTLTWENLLAAEKALRKSGANISYAFDGGMDFSPEGSGAGLLGQRLRVPLQYQGTLPLRDLVNDPMILLRSPAARKLAERIVGGILAN